METIEYTISKRDTDGHLVQVGSVMAASHGLAANEYAYTTHGEHAVVSRTSGHPFMSGWFQVYEYRGDLGGYSSLDSEFLVQEAE
jgi:hypothetical protein